MLRYAPVLSVIFLITSCGGGGGGGSTSSDTPDPSTVVLAKVIEPGAVCSNGGALIQSGIDENSNGILDATEVDNEDIICNGSDGVNGLTSLIAQTTEPAGENCIYGGIRIDSGLDLDNSSVLDANEISATAYICSTAVNVPANGFAVTDAWGEVWDGLPRPMAIYSDAQATCQSIGARLPTASELYRNNLSTGISDRSISTSTATEALWTFIPTSTSNTRVTVRLSDGTTGAVNESSNSYYRCVWPDTSPVNFAQDACYGAPGNACWTEDNLVNVDSMDRLPLDYIGAAAECAFSKAGIPVLSQWQNYIHGGLVNATNNLLFSSNAMYWYSANYGSSVIRWDGTVNQQWYYSPSFGGVAWSSTQQAFRCSGSLSQELLITETTPACNGVCFSTTNRGSRLIADSEDRVAATHAEAATSCRSVGAELPNHADISELIHNGMPNGSGAWVWLSDPVYWYSGGYGNAIVNWSGTGAENWSYTTGSGGTSAAISPQAYRCIWRQKINDLPTCAPGEGMDRVQNNYNCVSSVDGDSAGNAVPGGSQLVDTWGNAWDLQQRTAATQTDAASMCTSLGGRLPTASEVYAVRANQSLSSAIGDVSATDNIWTKTPRYLTDNSVVIRVSDGVTTSSLNTNLNPYRCIWPSTKGNTLAGRSCYGACFTPDSTTIADSHDRPALPVSSAIEECRASGGYLPDFREIQKLIHQGWDNGSNTWLWASESMYWYSAGYGYPLVRWGGTGNSSWEYTASTTGGIDYGTSFRNFRCIYSSLSR